MRFKNFLKRFQFEYLYNVLRESYVRFPLSVLSAVGGMLVWLMDVHDINWLGEDTINRLRLFFVDALALFTALKLYAEGAKLAPARTWVIMSLAGALLTAVVFVPGHFSEAQFFFSSAIALSMLFAPYLSRTSSEDSVWFFTYQNGIGLAIAGISTFTLCLGLSAIVGSLGYLFPVLEASGWVYGDIWTFGYAFFGPVAFMYQIPKQFDFEKDECLIPKGIYFIANYLAVPLLLIYTFILYVYFAKIIALWELPKGNLAYLVTGFGSAGIAARLAVFPMRQNGTVLLQQFYKYFFILLLIPISLLAIGIYTRICEYGVTEQRYAIALCLVWLTGLAGLHLFAPLRAHIKHVPIALCALFLPASFGPWSAVDVSTRSQVSRIYASLEKNGLLVNGKIVKTEKEIPFTERKDISGILDYLYESRREDEIAGLIDPFRKEITGKNSDTQYNNCGARSFSRCWWGYDRASKLMKAWGMVYVNQYETVEQNDYVSVRANYVDWNSDTLTKIAPYDYVVRFYSYYANGSNGDWSTERVYKENGVETLKIKFLLDRDGQLTIMKMRDKEEGAKVTFALLPLLEKLDAEKVTEIKEGEESKVTLRQETAGLKAEIRVSELRGRRAGDKLNFEMAQVTVLLSP